MNRSLPAIVALLLWSTNSLADVADTGADYDPGKAKRRSDFALGGSFAGTFGTVSGYPNDAAKIGLDRYHESTGKAGGATLTLWLGAALSDWLAVGIGFSGSSVAGSSTLSQGGAFVLHTELFPLFSRGGAFRDLAVVGDFGVGQRKINRASAVVADGGSASFVALGLLYEPIRIGRHVSGGPIVQVAEQFSDTLQSTLVTAGFQIAYYGGPT